MQALYTWILVHMVNIQLGKTHLPSFDIVVVALPMYLFISVSMSMSLYLFSVED